MDDKIFQNSLYITSMKQKLSGPIEAHGPFIFKQVTLHNTGIQIVTKFMFVNFSHQ